MESTVSRAALSSPGRTIRGQDVEFLHASDAPVDEQRERLPSLREAERTHIVRVLDEVGWNKKQASEILEFDLQPDAHVKGVRGRARSADAG